MSPRKLSKDMVYQLKITLRDSKPPIWRRLLVSGQVSLLDFHRIIQVAMGWTNSHLHQFIIEDKYYSIPNEDDWQPVMDERKYRLAKFAVAEGRKFVYEYDFGDSWEHLVLVEKILSPDPDATYPLCIKGKRACPPEDVGGVWGYEEFIEAIRDPAHEEHEAYLEWVGGDFDPEAFDLVETNRRLQEIDKMAWWDEWEG